MTHVFVQDSTSRYGIFTEVDFMDYKDLGANIDENGEAIESLKLMANWKNRPRDVSYPALDVAREGESLRWLVI